MATADPPTAARARLVDSLRDALEAHPAHARADAERLACLLIGRGRFAGLVGEPPGGHLASLPPPFEGLSIPAAPEAAVADHDSAAGAAARAPASIGAAYEAALGPEARGDLGQFFTPPPVADALVRWALNGVRPAGGPPRVLDPAVGTGTFLLRAFQQLRNRGAATGPVSLLEHLVGVDVDTVALQLAGLRLAAAAGVAAPDRLALHHTSFFDCAPAGTVDVAGAVELPPVDAVVGNPPFVRAEDLQPDAEHFRRHLATFGPPGEAPLLDGPGALSRRCDAYVYFVTHATRFLRPGGRLALVLPTKWLMSDYGQGLRRFLYDRYQVHAVVGVGGRTFGDALIDTALLLAVRTDEPDPDQTIRFVQLDDPAGLDELQPAMSGESMPAGPPPTTARPQTALTAAESLARYLEAPPELLSVLESGPFVRLDALAEVIRGTMTGANRFFFVDDDTAERFGLEPHFLHPAVKSLRSVDRPTVAAADVNRQLVDVHPFVAAVYPTLDDDADLESAVKAALAADGHDGLLAYVEHAEAAGWHEGRTCQSRPVWFDLGPLRAPAAFVPKLLRERVFAVRNAAGAVPSNAIDSLWPADRVDAGALVAALNASVGKAAMEVSGRDEAGLLQLMTYETASLATLDVRALSAADTQTLARAGDAYAEDPGPATLTALDEVVDALFDLALGPATLREHATALRRQRVDGGESASPAA